MSWRPTTDGGGRDLRPVGEVLDRALRGLGGAGASTLELVFSRWEELVGPQVAAHAQPLTLRGSTLVIAADEPAWATQLRLLSGSLLARLDEVSGPGAVTTIEVRVRR
jgi:predicted nucleic acid-binding Zn ribbon protein